MADRRGMSSGQARGGEDSSSEPELLSLLGKSIDNIAGMRKKPEIEGHGLWWKREKPPPQRDEVMAAKGTAMLWTGDSGHCPTRSEATARYVRFLCIDG